MVGNLVKYYKQQCFPNIYKKPYCLVGILILVQNIYGFVFLIYVVEIYIYLIFKNLEQVVVID